ncbi:hypothetical protein ACFE04_008941 [Oxalis oulophora]
MAAADSIGRQLSSQFLKPQQQFSPSLPIPTSQILSFSHLLKVNSQLIKVKALKVKTVNFKALSSQQQQGSTLHDDSPVSIQLQPICSETQFDQVIDEAQQVDESVVVWVASWCRKCIYLKPKLEKLAAHYYPRLRFYCVDVNTVPHKLVTRAGVTLWKDGRKQAEVIGGHKAHFIVTEVCEMIENNSTE